MSFKSMQLSLLRSTVRKRILEIRESPREGMASLLKLGTLLPSDPETEDLLKGFKLQLRDERSASYRLFVALARQVELENLSVFGINLGYHALSAGKKRIRRESAEGFHIPWCLSLDPGDASRHLPPSLLQQLLSQGQALGIHCYQLTLAPSYPAFDALLSVLRGAEDCACILLLSPETVTEARALQLAALPNLLLLLDLDGGDEAALSAALSLTEGRLRGGFTRYTQAESEVHAALERADALGLPLLALLGADGPAAAQTEGETYLDTLRRELPYPVFPFDLHADVARIDRAVSKRAVLASISPEGLLSLRGETVDGGERTLPLSHAGLKETLRAALPL